ncbi:MAG: hypothetical protein Q8906_06510 [Bacillota bacterium]|nr:hypothetical protein [Bacillota bacterium]
MERPKNKFLEELALGLGSHEEKETILQEYGSHIDDLMVELMKCETEESVREQLVARLGSPEEIALLWKEELSVTPSKMKLLFLMLNIIFFIGGSLLTLAHNLFQWHWLSVLWGHLTAIPTIIAFLYMFFWALLGYEIGKGFGHQGRKMLKKTFLLSLAPNLLLMVLTVFHIIPHRWFAPLLTNEFIIACILFTISLYPISWIGYRWGRKVSV